MKALHTPHLPNLAKSALLCLSLLLVPIQTYASDVSFTWTANPEPLTGYKLYYKTGENSAPPYDGTGLNEGDSPILLEKVTSYIVTGLSPNETYHFVITAVNEADEGEYSSIVSIMPVPFPGPTINIMTKN